MANKYFIAGTDTDAGKTLVSSALLYAARQAGLKTSALKPVAAGCEETEAGLRNSDALILHQQVTETMTYDEVNPLALKRPVSPHIAAAEEGVHLGVSDLLQQCGSTLARDSELQIVEGAGGWFVPLNPTETLADFAVALNFPVVLVVGLKLGCINHALLTAQAIREAGLPLHAWVANQVGADMDCVEENLATLAHRLHCPCLGHVPFLSNPTPKAAADYLDIHKLLV